MTKFSFCEPVWATGRSRWHIRKVGPEGLKLGGGANAPLCWNPDEWQNGWDLDVEITEHHLGHSCPRCVELYRELQGKENGKT